MVTALMVPPAGQPSTVQLMDNRNFLNLAVSADTDYRLTATALKIEDGIVALHSDKGMLMMVPPNRQIGSKIIAGTFNVVSHHNGKLRSLTDAEIVKFTSRFWGAEFHTDEEVFDSLWP